MTFTETLLQGAWLVESTVKTDARGFFRKTFRADLFEARGLRMQVAEEYYSVSGANVVRGMHFQAPPHAVEKLVYCAAGAVLDVIVDLRIGSPTYGQHAAFELTEDNRLALFIPIGLAHGFLSLSAGSLLVYKCSSIYAPDHDRGVRWDSIGFVWPIKTPLVSVRDQALPALDGFNSPFV